MPTVDVLFSLAEAREERVSGLVVVAIDVLRATTTAITALAHGARAVWPVAEPEEGRRVVAAFPPGEAMLGGERQGRPLPGFDRGNSPREYASPAVRGRTVVLTTTNGTRLLVRCAPAAEVVLGALVNASAVARWLRDRQEDAVLACAGQDGRFSLEDAVCAGLLVHLLGRGWRHGDGALAALGLFGLYRDEPARALAAGPHGRYLASIGLGEDLKDCGAVDRFTLVPRRHGSWFA